MRKFYELTTNMIMCDACVLAWKLESQSGKLTGDEAYDPAYIVGLAETPAQCDNCLEQSDDYDSVLDEGV